MIVVLDDRGRIADLNRSAQEFLGLVLHPALGRPIAGVLPELAHLPALATLPLTGREGVVEFEAQTTPLLSDAGVLVGHLIILRDITPQRQVESGLQAAVEHEREINEMKSRFYSYFTHQLRTPLSVVLSSSELLEHYGRDWNDEKRSLHFQRIYQAINHLLELADRATIFDRSERRQQPPLKAETFDPEEMTGQLIDEMRLSDHRRHPLRFEFRGEPCQAHQDRTLVRAVLENIIGNALKFSPPGRPVKVLLVLAENQMHFTVRDEGCGIPADELARVNQPFFRASNVAAVPGTGLGLAIVSHYLAQLGGQMRLESQEGAGTTVQISLPLELPA
jgi:signal transduction histidine kinase